MIEVYLQAFVNLKQNNRARLLLIVEFVYNNINNVNTGYMLFKLNYSYHPHIFYKENINSCPQSKLADD